MSQAPQSETIWTVGKLLQWTIQWFQQKNIEDARLAAELLLSHAMGCSKIELYTRYDAVPGDDVRAAFRQLAQQAGENKPIAYLLGRREFYLLDFEVSPAVLIPRPETEAIVQRVVDLCKEQPSKTWQVADIGTGSGCIAICIAKFATNTQVVASDVSPEAVEVARANAEKHGVADRVTVIEADGPDYPCDVIPEGGFDLVVTNPPYISESIYAELPPHIREYEPSLALTGAKPGDGLAMYRRLASDAGKLLRASGRIMMEIGFDQRQAVEDIFASSESWTFVSAFSDPTDPHDRVLEMERH